MNTLLWIIVGVIVFGGAAALVVVGIRYSGAQTKDESDPVLERLAEATQRGEVVSLEDAELQEPFTERVLIPIIRRIGDLSTRFTPQNLLTETTRKLELGGNPGRIDAATFLATRFVVAFVFGGLLLTIALLAKTSPLSRTILVVSLFTAIGFFFHQLWLHIRINRHHND